jgi:hypothetical protein
MKSISKFIILSFLLILTLSANSTAACTIISASDGETVLFGGNEDQFPNESYLVVDKRGKLGVVYFATPWKKSPLVMQMGINEKGLCFDSNWIPTEKLTPHPERISREQMKSIQESASVDEVLSKVFKYEFGDSMNYQIHIADKSGEAAVIYPGLDGELSFSKKDQKKGYLITTNFNHARRERVSRTFLDRIYTFRFDTRYEPADTMLSRIMNENTLSVASLTSVLDEVHRNWIFETRFSLKTIYSAVYDLKALKIYLYLDSHFDKPFVISVKEELASVPVYKKVSLKDLVLGKK